MADIIIYITKLLLKLSLSNFRVSRLKKINDLLEKEVFEIINKEDVLVGTRVFDSCFVN